MTLEPHFNVLWNRTSVTHLEESATTQNLTVIVDIIIVTESKYYVGYECSLQ